MQVYCVELNKTTIKCVILYKLCTSIKLFFKSVKTAALSNVEWENIQISPMTDS